MTTHTGGFTEPSVVKPLPTLYLGEFQPPLFLDFRYVTVGESKALGFAMKVMDQAIKGVSLKVDKEPKGFKVSFDSSNSLGQLTWSPVKAGPTREVILLKMNDRHRLQITALGQALPCKLPAKKGSRQASLDKPSSTTPADPKHPPTRRAPLQALGNSGNRPLSTPLKTPGPPVKPKPPSSSSSSSSTSLSTLRSGLDRCGDRLSSLLEGSVDSHAITLPIAPQSVTEGQEQTSSYSVPSTPKSSSSTQGLQVDRSLIKVPTSTALVSSRPAPRSTVPRVNSQRGPPVASFRQELVLTEWLNYTFCPPEVTPTMSHAADIFRAQEDVVRQRAQALYDSQELAEARTRVQAEVARGRLSIRDDRDLYADLNLREGFLTLLLSYQLPWLQMGLEVVLGLELSRSRVARTREGELIRVPTLDLLRKTIVQRILNDPEISRRYAGKCAVPSGRFGEAYRKELRFHTVQRFLALVHFLDRAKGAELLPRKRTLFKPSAEVKSSADLLARFSKDNLSAEGNIVKHLANLRFTVSYEQTYVDEFDFRTTCLARDLRDGVRLSRLADLMVEGQPICPSLRVPAVSRLQKIYNVRLALDKLGRARVWGPSRQVTPEDIVDGNREKTISALWQVVKHFNLDFVVVSLRGVTILQAHIRRKIMQRRYSRLRHLALSFQRLYRSHRVYFHCRSFPVPAVLVLQRRWRAIQSHRIMVYLDSQATRISQVWRRYAAAKRVAAMMNAVRLIQQATRARLERKHRQRLDQSATSIARVFRGHLTRRALHTQACAATSIQSSWRAHHGRQAFLHLRASAIVLQSMLRAASAQRAALLRRRSARCIQRALVHRHAFRSQSAVSVQRAWRGYCARQQLHIQSHAALTIQRTYKGLVQRRCYHQALLAVIRLQSWTRSRLHQKTFKMTVADLVFVQRSLRSALQRRRYHLHDSSRKIQQCWRRCRAQSTLHQARAAAVRMQSTVRRYQAQRSYQIVRRQVIVLQAAVRCMVSSRRYNHLHQATVLVQRQWRGHVVRREFGLQHAQAALLQRWWRMVSARHHFHQAVSAVVTIQAVLRGRAARVSYAACRDAATRLEAQIRGHLVRRHLRVLRSSAVAIQRAWRCRVAHHEYRQALSMVVLIQTNVRAFYQRRRYLQLQAATATVQRSFRCFKARSALQRERAAREIQRLHRGYVCRCHLQHKHQSAVMIQSVYRGYSQRQLFCATITAITRLQALARRRACQQAFHTACREAVLLQSAWRGVRARRQLALAHEMATSVQSQWRRHRAQLSYMRSRRGWVQCQAAVRAWVARRRFQRLRAGVVCAQRAWRAWLYRRWVKMWGMCVALQSLWRGRRVRLELGHQHRCATVLQAAWRGSREYRAYHLLRQQVTTGQAMIRRFLHRRQYHAVRNATLTVQRWYRCVLMARQQQLVWLVQQLQKLYRAHRVRLHLATLHQKATAIQAAWRRRCHQERYQRFLRAVVVVQSLSRARPLRASFLRHRDSALTLQRVWRGELVRQQMAVAHVAALHVQRIWRGHQAFRVYAKKVHAIVILQSQARCAITRRRYQRTVQTFVALQRVFRLRLFERRMQAHRMKVIAIQSLWRQRVQRQLFLRQRWAVAKLQSYARGRGCRSRMSRLMGAIVTLQSRFRGWRVRRRNSSKVRALRARVQEAHKKALADPTLQIGHRHSMALEVLLTSKSCSLIIKCCETLEVSTRLSKVCCEALVAARGIAKLVSLIRSCNRSKPHMELLRHVLHVLQNVATYDHMVLYVSECEGIEETLVELLQHHSYKDLTFMPAALLLLRLKKADIRVEESLQVPDTARRIQGLMRLLGRKAEQERALKSTRYQKAEDKDVAALVPLRVLRLIAGPHQARSE